MSTSPETLTLLAAVERGEIVRMPGGVGWNVHEGRFQSGMEPLYRTGLVTVEPVTHVAMDRTYALTDAGKAALRYARHQQPEENSEH